MGNAVIQYVLYLAVVVSLAVPLGNYIGKVDLSVPGYKSRGRDGMEKIWSLHSVCEWD